MSDVLKFRKDSGLNDEPNAAACDGAVPLWCPGDAELAEVDAVGRAVAVGQAAADGEWLVVLVDFDELQAAAVIATAIRPRMSWP